MKKIRIGLLPFYLKMHDDFFPQRRTEVGRYLTSVIGRLEGLGFNVTAAPVCRIKPEFDAAAELLNAAGLEAVITLHIVYSPSLEAIDALASLNAPLIVLDTTPDFDFGERRQAGSIRPNIGIHGVQDMCSLLTRRNIPFTVIAGHMDGSDVLLRLQKLVRCAAAANCMRTGRVGQIGGVYPGMGDFHISPERMQAEIGAEVVQADFTRHAARISPAEIEAQLAEYARSYDIRCPVDDDFRESARANLMVRQWLQDENLCAFTANFMGIGRDSGIPRFPFAEASEGMSRGIGYAGEGDTLTALLTSALHHIYPDVSFTEMFAPGWSDNSVFLSHMGEINPAVCARRPVIGKMNMIFSDTGDVSCLYGAFRAGSAVLVNLAPLAAGFRLILAPVEMFERPAKPDFAFINEGWFYPPMPLVDFLERFSQAGGTHHSVLCYDGDVRTLSDFGRMMNFDVRILDKQ